MAKLIGTNPNQVPTNADLGSAAYADTQNMPETRFTNRALSAKFGAAGDVPTNLATDLDFVQISGSTFIQTGSDAQAFIKSNNYWNGAGTSYVDTTRGSTTIRLNENNAGIFQVETAPSGGTATSARLIVDENGIVRMPYQSAFQLRQTTSQSNMAANDSVVTILWQTEVFDNNGDVNGSSFFAPVTGKYFLQTSVYLANLDTAAAYYLWGIRTSNRDYYSLIDPNFSTDLNYFTFNVSVVADMDAGDTAYVWFQQSGGTAQTDTVVSNGTFFSGCLVA